MYRTIVACIIISVPIFITMEIAIKIFDCLVRYKSGILRIKKKMLGIKCNDDIYDDIYDDDIYDDDIYDDDIYDDE